MSENRRPLSAYIDTLGPVGALRYLVSGNLPSPTTLPAQPTPTGEDFVMARDYFQARGISVTDLQSLAGNFGIGLPIAPVSEATSPFEFEDFAALQQVCAE